MDVILDPPDVFVRNPYNYSMEVASVNSGLFCDDETRTIQSQKDDADINTIVRRFGLTGTVPTSVRLPQYGDFTGIFDFQSAQNAIVEADRSFMAIPADIRARFANDPQRFLVFCSDPANLPELRRLGLAKPEEPSPPAPVPPVDPA